MEQQTAQLNYLHIAPRKVRLVANTLKGLPLREAEAQLMLRPQRAAKPLLKLIRSAAANAKHNQKADEARLVIQAIRVDQGPVLKRGLPRAQGRMTPIYKRMSHVTVTLGERSALPPSRFTIIPPPKKEKKETRGERSKAKEMVKPKSEPKAFEKPKEKGGFFRRIFRRKSV